MHFFFFFLPFLIGFFFPLVCTISRVTVGGVWHFGNAISEDTKDFPEQLNNIEGDWIVPDFFHWLFFIGRAIFSAWLSSRLHENSECWKWREIRKKLSLSEKHKSQSYQLRNEDTWSFNLVESFHLKHARWKDFHNYSSLFLSRSSHFIFRFFFA